MNWQKLKTFYFVAKAGSFTNAGDILNVSQSAVSRSIIGLEDRLGIKVFNRHARGVTLTKQGEILFGFAHKMYVEDENVTRILKGTENEPKGELTILATPTLASSWLIHFFPGFLGKYPDMKLKIIDDNREDSLQLKAADVAIRTFIPLQTDLVQRYLTTIKLKMFASKSYLKKFGIPRKPEDLDHHRVITLNDVVINPHTNINWILRVGVEPEKTREPFMELNSSEVLLKAAKLGLGIVAIGMDHPKLAETELEEVLPAIPGPDIEVFYIYPEHLKNSKRITVLAEYLSDKQVQKKILEFSEK